MREILAYSAGAIVGLWGFAHALPTGQVLVGFQPLTRDNRRVLIQEWLAEAVTMWGIAALVIVVTAAGDGVRSVGLVYRACAAILVALAVLTGLTGARTAVIWFKVCPALLTSAAVLLLVASVVS